MLSNSPVVVVLAVLNFIFGGVCGGVSESGSNPLVKAPESFALALTCLYFGKPHRLIVARLIGGVLLQKRGRSRLAGTVRRNWRC